MRTARDNVDEIEQFCYVLCLNEFVPNAIATV